MTRVTLLKAQGADVGSRQAGRLALPLISSLLSLAYPASRTFAATEPVSVFVKEEQRRDGMVMYDSQEGMVPKYVTDEILVITSHDDSVTIKDVIVNRGNCKVEKYVLPKTLKFGESVEVVANCIPLEAVINTDNKSSMFEFSEPRE